MERPHYRRVTKCTAPTGVNPRAKAVKSTFSERLVVQFIICGVVMALILIANLIDTSATRNISASIKDIIQTQPSSDEIKQVLTDASDTARTILGNTVHDDTMDNFVLATDALMLDEESPDNVGLNHRNTDDFRIDEDILKLIQAESGGQ